MSNNPALDWYRRIVWIGIGVNLWFAFQALYAPSRILNGLGLKELPATIWLRNVGMLLVQVSMFNAGSALDPTRYPLYSWFVPIARLIASFFFFLVGFFNPLNSSERPHSFFWLAITDFSFGTVCAFLLKRGLAAARKPV